MFTKEDILARLQNGETTDTIAQEMTDALNAAATEYLALETKRIEEEKALEAKRAEEDRAKREAICRMIDAFSDFLIAGGDEDLLAETQNIDPDKMVRMMDDMIEFAHGLEELKHIEFPRVEDKKKNSGLDLIYRMFMN